MVAQKSDAPGAKATLTFVRGTETKTAEVTYGERQPGAFLVFSGLKVDQVDARQGLVRLPQQVDARRIESLHPVCAVQHQRRHG